MKLDKDEYICPNGHRFRAKFICDDRIYCPKCYKTFTKKHLDAIKKKLEKGKK